MKTFITVALLATFVGQISASGYSCGDNEEYSDCVNCCPGIPTCEQAVAGETPSCSNEHCEAGCRCKEGYARNSDGACVAIEHCFSCSKREFFTSCFLDCPREQTCQEYIDGVQGVCSEGVVYPCYPKCKCQEGYVRNSRGACVYPNECCEDPNAEIVECPNLCPGGTCEQPEFAPCFIGCPYRGCQCKKGYVKNSKGKCIHLSKCPKPKPTPKPKCPVNEIWTSDCPDCPEQCDNIGKPRCKSKKPGCACVSGYVREKKGGKCIKKSSCKKY